MIGVENKEYILKTEVEKVKDEYDFVVIDCPPALSMLTINAMTTADSIIVPIQCEYYALEGLSQLIHTIELVQERLNPNLEIEGVVFTMYDARTNLSLQVVENVKDYVHEHYAEDISRQDIESSVHLNGDYLNRIFKKATGYSLVQYIQYYRILVSKRLLAEQKCTITEAGTKVGFDTPSYFAKVFKKWTNMTPNEYYNSIDSR